METFSRNLNKNFYTIIRFFSKTIIVIPITLVGFFYFLFFINSFSFFEIIQEEKDEVMRKRISRSMWNRERRVKKISWKVPYVEASVYDREFWWRSGDSPSFNRSSPSYIERPSLRMGRRARPYLLRSWERVLSGGKYFSSS